MTPRVRTVNTPRRYDGTRRREQAEETRRSVLDTARRLFLDHGYAGTTIAAIATAADVSAETIYKSFGNKQALVRAIRDRALEGAGPVPAEQRSDAVKLPNADPRDVIAHWARLTTEVAPRVMPILLLVRDAAAVDAELVTLVKQMDQARLARMTDNARFLHSHGHLRPGVTLQHARDIMFAYTTPELYETLVLRRRWNMDNYANFIETALIAALLK